MKENKILGKHKFRIKNANQLMPIVLGIFFINSIPLLGGIFFYGGTLKCIHNQ